MNRTLLILAVPFSLAGAGCASIVPASIAPDAVDRAIPDVPEVSFRLKAEPEISVRAELPEPTLVFADSLFTTPPDGELAASLHEPTIPVAVPFERPVVPEAPTEVTVADRSELTPGEDLATGTRTRSTPAPAAIGLANVPATATPRGVMVPPSQRSQNGSSPGGEQVRLSSPEAAVAEPQATALLSPPTRSPDVTAAAANVTTEPVAVESSSSLAPGGTIRYAVAPAGSDVTIRMPGEGWLYLGHDYDGAEVDLLSRSTGGNDQVFVFRFPDPGEQTLWFQQQNPRSGSLENRRLSLIVGRDGGNTELSYDLLSATPVSPLPAAALDGVLAGRNGNEPTGVPGEDTPSQATFLVAEIDTIDEFLRALQGSAREQVLGDTALHEQLAGSDVLSYPMTVQRDFWNSVASTGSSIAPLARWRFLESAIELGSSDDVALAVERLATAGQLRSGAETQDAGSDATEHLDLAPAAAELLGSGPHDAELGHLTSWILPVGEQNPAILSRFSDQEIYLMGTQALERRTGADLSRAITLFSYIVDSQPLSAFWDASRERLEYIDRHYIDVR